MRGALSNGRPYRDRVQGEVFGAIRPAATIVVVSRLLRPEMKVEIEADARLGRPLNTDGE